MKYIDPTTGKEIPAGDPRTLQDYDYLEWVLSDGTRWLRMARPIQEGARS